LRSLFQQIHSWKLRDLRDGRGEVQIDGAFRGLTGRELCRAAWAGTFKAFGAAAVDEGALIVVALGPQQEALGELAPPPNSICMPMLPQVDILKAGVDLFLTHGGQNSFMEALSNARGGLPWLWIPASERSQGGGYRSGFESGPSCARSRAGG